MPLHAVARTRVAACVSFIEISAEMHHTDTPRTVHVLAGPNITGVRALRDIESDEEIFISYVNPTLPWSVRAANLREQVGRHASNICRVCLLCAL